MLTYCALLCKRYEYLKEAFKKNLRAKDILNNLLIYQNSFVYLSTFNSIFRNYQKKSLKASLVSYHFIVFKKFDKHNRLKLFLINQFCLAHKLYKNGKESFLYYR